MFNRVACPICDYRFLTPEASRFKRQICPNCQSPFVPGESNDTPKLKVSPLSTSQCETVHVYLCSELTDTLAEREYLHKHVFPIIREHYREKGISFVVVDPWRWDDAILTGEDAAFLRRLDAIGYCRHVFIALIGNRYGDVIRTLPESVLRNYQHLKVFSDRSRFELEIVHGVLSPPRLANHAFFYFRNPTAIGQIATEYSKFSVLLDDEERDRSATLKNNILKAEYPVCEYSCQWDVQLNRFVSFDELGDRITNDLLSCLQKLAQALPPVSAQNTCYDDFNDNSLSVDHWTRDNTPTYRDDNVQFTLYRPRVVAPLKWATLLAFAHLAQKRPDDPKDDPDPLDEMERQAHGVLGEHIKHHQIVTHDSLLTVPREGTLTFVPELAGFEFNPPRQSVYWEEPVHRVEFRMRASAELEGKSVRGKLSVYLGCILAADIHLSIKVSNAQQPAHSSSPNERTSATPYRKIFASYSHNDMEIVKQIENYAKTLGDRFLRDWVELRAGEIWDKRIQDLIEAADVFQLFWSTNSMLSKHVRSEWEYALSLGRPNFVRPTYWEEPLPESVELGLPPEELRRLHFERLSLRVSQPAAKSLVPPISEKWKRINCPTCNHKFNVRESEMLKRHVCPNCQSPFLAGKSVPVGDPSLNKTLLVDDRRPIKLNCPRCMKPLETPASEGGTKRTCPSCGQRLKVPDAPKSPTSAPGLDKTMLASDEAIASSGLPIKFTCPRCQKPMEAPAHDVGAKMTCPSCNQRVKVPAACSTWSPTQARARRASPSSNLQRRSCMGIVIVALVAFSIFLVTVVLLLLNR